MQLSTILALGASTPVTGCLKTVYLSFILALEAQICETFGNSGLRSLKTVQLFAILPLGINNNGALAGALAEALTGALHARGPSRGPCRGPCRGLCRGRAIACAEKAPTAKPKAEGKCDCLGKHAGVSEETNADAQRHKATRTHGFAAPAALAGALPGVAAGALAGAPNGVTQSRRRESRPR